MISTGTVGQLFIQKYQRYIAPATPSGPKSWTFVDSDGDGQSPSSLTIATPGVTVHAGDLSVVLVAWEGGSTTSAVSDGTTTLTPWSLGVLGNSLGDPQYEAFYIPSSVTSGVNTVVYTATFGAARTFRNITVMTYTPVNGTVSLDGTPSSATGNTTAPASGNTTTTGTVGISFGFYAEFGHSLEFPKVNGVDYSQFQQAGTLNGVLYSVPYSSGFTGQASATLSGANHWNLGVMSFKIT